MYCLCVARFGGDECRSRGGGDECIISVLQCLLLMGV